MAATLMHSPVHRPPMDHHAASPPPRTASSNAPSPVTTPTGAAPAYPQYGNPNYHHPGYGPHPAWQANAPASMYPPPFGAQGAFHPPFHPQHQQTPDFSAWAHVYQQMVASGHMPPPHAAAQGYPPQLQQHLSQREELHLQSTDGGGRRRTTSVSSASQTGGDTRPAAASGAQPQPYHPYKRGPAQQRGMPRSASQPSSALNELIKSSGSGGIPPAEDHRRTSSADSALGGGTTPDLAAPPRIRTAGERRNSAGSQTSSRSRSSTPSASVRTASPLHSESGSKQASKQASQPSSKPTPLTPGVIAANATNTAARPSPLSQPAAAPAPAKKVPFKSRFKTSSAPDKYLPNKEVKKEQPQQQQQQQPPQHQSSSASRPPANGSVPLAPPSAPFVNPRAMGSDVSLADTERTAATAATGKSKRSLFRIRHKSADNISLASTVSSASMMIRKMGSLGKLARRNSLMGISKIFKDKPQDEDAPIPEKQGILSFKKKNGRKADLAPATVSPANAELDRQSEDDDRVLTSLSPAAQLARQHTVRSKAEAAKRDAEARRRGQAPDELTGPTGEPTWDKSTTTNRASQVQAAAADAQRASLERSNIVRVVPRSPDIVRHAFAVAQPDYDSDDSSDADTIEGVTASMNRTYLSDAADAEFQAMWGKADIDRNARPKKGILKSCISSEDLELLSRQQQSTPPREDTPPVVPSRLSTDLPGVNADIDGVPHAAHFESPIDSQYDPMSPDFSPFDSKPFELSLTARDQPVRNTSTPALPNLAQVPRPAQRAMTSPVPRRRLIWAPECAVYSTYDAVTYDRRSEPATCNRLTPELAMAIKQELNAFKLEMPVHPSSRGYTHYFA